MNNHWRTLSFILFMVCISLGGFYLGTRVDRNSDAIEKSCILLNNAILQSQGSGGGPEVSNFLVQEIVEGMTPAEQAEFAKLTGNGSPTGTVTTADCEKAADDPGSIKQIPPDGVDKQSSTTPNKEG